MTSTTSRNLNWWVVSESASSPSSIASGPEFEASELLLGALFQVGWLFKDIQESCRAIDSVTLRIAYPFHDTRTFQSFDGALRGRKRDRQFVGHAFYSDEGICPQAFDYTQRVVASILRRLSSATSASSPLMRIARLKASADMRATPSRKYSSQSFHAPRSLIPRKPS